jgi:O-antigen/teichoic acid export membrane protein
MAPVRIVSQVAWSYVSWGLIFVTGPLSLALLTRTLSIPEFGIYSLLVIVIRALPRLLSLGVPAYLTRTFPGQPSAALRRAIGPLVLATAAVAGLGGATLFALAWATGSFARSGLERYVAETWLALLAVELAVMLLVVRGFFAASRRLAMAQLLSLLDERLWLVLVVAVALAERVTLFNLLVLWNVGTAATLVVAGVTGGVRGLRWRADRGGVRAALAYGTPLLPFLAGFGLFWLIDRSLLSVFHPAVVVAQFSLAQSISLMVAAMGAVLHGALFPHLSASRTGAADERQYRRLFTLSTKYTMLIVVPLAIGVFTVREPLVTGISGPAYAPAADLLAGLLAIAALNALVQLAVQDLMLHDATRTVALVFGGALAWHLVVSLALVPAHGAEGAVAAGVLTHVALLAATAWRGHVWRRLDADLLRPARIGLATGAMLAGLGLAGTVAGWSIVAVVATGAVAYALSLLLSGAVGVAEVSRAWRATVDVS